MSGQAGNGALVHVEALQKHFHAHGTTVRAVDGVSFDVHAGETLAVVGESGCGKSTMARCLVRLEDPTAGRVCFRDRDVTALSRRRFRPLRRHIQMVFQDPHASLNPSMSVRQTLREPLRLFGDRDGGGGDDQLAELMRLVELDPALLGRRPEQLSGGQKQRVGIARAIATRPSFVVLDEPTAALDMSLRLSLLELLLRLQRELRMTYLFITHDFSTVRQIADRVVVMYRGRVMEHGPADAVLDDPAHPYTQALMSAIPRPIPRRRHRRAPVMGDVGSAAREPDGCPFQDRCPHAMPGCLHGEIPFFAVGGKEAACLLHDAQDHGPVGSAAAARDGDAGREPAQ
jgi:oligopeptide/dipeptide ABC transporter ATP-binding protein